jgi:hypothetical protein
MFFFSLGGSNLGHAIGTIKLESSGFLKNATDRSNSSTTFSIGPNFKFQNSTIEGQADIQVIGLTNNTKSITAEAPNLYLATSSLLMPHHQVTIGRRQYDWSQMDDEWKLGVYTPRFNWEIFRPQQVGTTGFFYNYTSRYFNVLAFASPITIPERGMNTYESDGKIINPSPFGLALYDQVQVSQKTAPIPIRYKIYMPKLSELISKPSVMLKARAGSTESGPWVQAMIGKTAVYQPELNVDAGLVPIGMYTQVDIYPRILEHTLKTIETGYQSKYFSIWASGTKEDPITQSKPSAWISNPVGSSTILSAGTQTSLDNGFKLGLSYLQVNESEPPVTNQEKDSVKISLASRYLYTKAAKISAEWDINGPLDFKASHTADIAQKSGLSSFDIFYTTITTDKGFTLNAGLDLFNSITNKGTVGQYLGNDRIRGGLSYVF